MPSLDDFMRELEEREKSLSISLTDEVVEIEAYYDFDRSEEPAFAPPPPEKKEEKPKVEQPAPKRSAGSDREISALSKQIQDFRKEREELITTMRRRQSDFESYKNRTERERGETFLKVLTSLANRMLPVVDNMNRALDAAKNSANKTPEYEQFLEGVILVSQHFQDVLAEMGIKPILAVGKPFDPHFHEAVAMESREEFPSNTVVEELLRGYCLGETVLRPSMVKVSK